MKSFENSKTLFRSTLIAAALAAGLGASATTRADATDAPQPHSDSVGAAVADTTITAQVKAKYQAEDRLKGSDIGVTTTNGVVTLTGTLANSESREIAITLAKGVDGVKSVDTSGLSPGSG